MLSYFIGLLYVLLSIVLYQLVGMCFTKKESYSYSFIMGFIIYSFFVAILGVAVQFLNLSWYVFFFGMIAIWIGLIFFIIYNFVNKRLKFSLQDFYAYIKENWFFYAGTVFLVLFALAHVATIWSNNLTDDSYYINLMATMPYVQDPFHVDPSTGFVSSTLSLERIINTFEIEGSFYVYITQMPATLYARVFLAGLNYFIILQSINAFLIKITKSQNKYNQFIITAIFLIFVMNAQYFLNTEAAWTITSAAYFGSALIRISCPFIVLLPLINDEKLDVKKMIVTFIICVVMVSKSTCAIPILYLLAIGYLVTYKIYEKYWYALLIPLMGVIGVVIPNNGELENYGFEMISNNATSVFLIIAFILMMIFAKNYFEHKRITIMIVVAMILSFVPFINNVYENLTQFTFVDDRTWYTLSLFIMISGFYCLVNFLFEKYIFRINIFIQIFLVAVITVGSGFVSVDMGKDMHAGMVIRNFLTIYKNNKYIIPQGTMNLGIELNNYYEETHKELKVLMGAGLVIDEHNHNTAAILRTFAPHIQSITGGIRIQTEIFNENSEFKGYDLDDLAIFNEFEINPCEETFKPFKQLNNEFPFDCVVILNSNNDHSEFLKTIGYHLYNKAYDNLNRYYYGIFIKEK